MKDSLSKVSDLTRISLQDLKKVFNILKLVDLMSTMNEESDEIHIEVPMFGTILINPNNWDFSFVPEDTFKKEIFSAYMEPENFLKKKLKECLKLVENEGVRKIE